ncbi:MAG: hypothetical protein ACLQD9_07915 [Thermoplasmata archaeon]
MSSPDDDLALVRRRTLELYDTVTLLMLLGIAIMIAYAIHIGPLTSPGAQQSFGLAIALMALMGAVLFHVVDRTYRSWPLGRKFSPTPPGPVTLQSEVRFVKVLIFVLAAAAIAYVLGGLLA